MIKRGFTLAIGASLALTVTGCGGVEPDAHYETVDDFHEALESEGFPCPEQGRADVFEGHGEELRCSSGMALIAWEEDMPDYAGSTTRISFGASLNGNQTLVSDTWMIIHDNPNLLDEIAETFGGERFD
ncbi:hypothetical protein ACFP47_09210 [Nesterenkonia lacusekhoensis]|uniref:Lipoprotein n=1 Tax=Nesterenkonia lacusekhoensis TaxID=150832 RepID=A0ABS4SZT2_9MICC|nr:hypothetical protein [Nesterenkonia lacusekhoensis]MBP2317405.1 hypothetical protein [Nesterenkonia lacusekhoensis]